MTHIDIGQLRKRLGTEEKPISQAELGKRIGVDQATVSRWETGTSKPDGPAERLLKLLDEGVRPPSEPEGAAA